MYFIAFYGMRHRMDPTLRGVGRSRLRARGALTRGNAHGSGQALISCNDIGNVMCKVRQFLGAILPLAANINMTKFAGNDVDGTSSDLDVGMTFKIHIKTNNIVIDCELTKWSKADHFMPLYMRALDTIRAVVDLAAF